MEDPFALDRDTVQQKLQQLQECYQRWRQLLEANSADEEQNELSQDLDDDIEVEFKWLTNEIQQTTKSISWDIDDLEETSKLMQERGQNMLEHEQRCEFVQSARSLVLTIDAQLRAVNERCGDAAKSPPSTTATSPPPPSTHPPPPPVTAISSATSRDFLLEDDDELLVPDRATRFRVAYDDDDEVVGPFWRRHRVLFIFVCCVMLMLLLILILAAITAGN